MACLPQLGSVPAVYAAVAGGCDWPLLTAIGLSNNDVIALRALRQLRQLCYVSYVRYAHYALTSVPLRHLCSNYVACVALDGNPALRLERH